MHKQKSLACPKIPPLETISRKPTKRNACRQLLKPVNDILSVKRAVARPTCCVDSLPGGDSSWERLSSLATDSGEETASPKDDYAAITAQLAAVGPAAGTRAKSKRPATTVSVSCLS